MSPRADAGGGSPLPPPTPTLKDRCVACVRGPNLLRTVVVCGCIALVVQQVSACIQKLMNKPISTHTHFDFNQTLLYPSVTFCREPPYKFDKMLEYGLYAHPRNTILWRDFNFSVPLDQLWLDVTYEQAEYFVQYALNEEADNVEVTATLGFVTGRCYTLSPKILSTSASRATGYSVTLRHSAEDAATSTSVYGPGYHVYIHYNKEPYTEISSEGAGLVDYLYVHTGEELDIKISVDEYKKISTSYDPCNVNDDYSASQCMTELVWQAVGEQAGCSGPWMESPLPHCDNYTQIRDLISTYIGIYEDHEKWRLCPRLCHSLLYSAYVTNRQREYWWDDVGLQRRAHSASAVTIATASSVVQYQTQLYVHFNSMMVSVYEERYNYDWNLFLSDLGGSIGFLLGLSVIGVMKIIGKVCGSLVRPIIVSPRKSGQGSLSTALPEPSGPEAKPSDGDFVVKCDDWNRRNDLLNN